MSDDDKTRYKAELPANIGPFKQLLEAYSQIPSEAVEARIHKTVSITRWICRSPTREKAKLTTSFSATKPTQ